MELNEIIESGILELYVLNQLSPAEVEQVEAHIIAHPELKKEIKSIEHALMTIGNSVSEPSSPSLKKKILEEARRSNDVSNGVTWPTRIFTLLSAAAMLAFLFMWNNERQNNALLNQEMSELQASCDSLQTSSQVRLALFQELNHPDNDILAFEATPNFQSTKLYFHTNESTAKNFIQVLGLPEIDSDKTFQLWSLREGEDPMPLDIFDGESDILEVDYIQGTSAYAITVEKSGGSETPNLDQLIGIVKLTG